MGSVALDQLDREQAPSAGEQDAAPKPSPYAKSGPWITRLNPAEEQKFRAWVQQNKIPFDLNDQYPDYDMRGYYKAMVAGNPQAKQGANQHFPDTWKSPYHRSFSRESMYATPGAPQWKATDDGSDLVDKDGKVVYSEDREGKPIQQRRVLPQDTPNREPQSPQKSISQAQVAELAKEVGIPLAAALKQFQDRNYTVTS
jgi:hypothetical protein